MEEVVLVDTNDAVIGCMEKMRAHCLGALHRAVSVCLFDGSGRWLLQQRSFSKYHSPGKWSNSCCSHPLPGETPEKAASRRLFEELGIVCPLVFCTSFLYKADVGNGLLEHEYDHLFIGRYDGPLFPNPEEIQQCTWWSTDEIRVSLQKSPSLFTMWFPMIFDRVLKHKFDDYFKP